MTSQALSTTEADGKGIERNEREVPSPQEFYREFTQRPDVREIMKRLANWQTPADPPDGRGN